MSTYVLVDDVADGRVRVPVSKRLFEERLEGGVVNVELVDLVEDVVDEARVDDVLRLEWYHVLLHTEHHNTFSDDRYIYTEHSSTHLSTQTIHRGSSRDV